MKNTVNYGLNKPEGTDYINIEDLNENADKIDTELKSHSDSLAEVSTHLADKANNTDSSRTTTSKTVTGAINELNTNKLTIKYDKSYLPSNIYSDFSEGITIGIYPISASDVTFTTWRDMINNLLGITLTQYRIVVFTEKHNSSDVVQTVLLYSVTSGQANNEIARLTRGRYFATSMWGNWNVSFPLIVGSGSPEGVVTAIKGTKYFDNLNSKLFIKLSAITGSNNVGWKEVYAQ